MSIVCDCGHSLDDHPFDNELGTVCTAGNCYCTKWRGQPENNSPQENPVLPVDHIVVNDLYIEAHRFLRDFYYDTDNGNLTVTFCGVTDLHVEYRGLVKKDQE
jgi:hypothetical protein